MDNFYDLIMKSLRNGTSIEDIAADFSNNLNSAEKRYLKEKEEKAKKLTLEKEKRADVKKMMQCVFDFYKKWYKWDLGTIEDEDIDEVLRSLDKINIDEDIINDLIDMLIRGLG